MLVFNNSVITLCISVPARLFSIVHSSCVIILYKLIVKSFPTESKGNDHSNKQIKSLYFIIIILSPNQLCFRSQTHISNVFKFIFYTMIYITRMADSVKKLQFFHSMIVSPMEDKKAKGDSEIDFGTICAANFPRVNLNYSYTKWFVNFQIKFE